MGRHEQALMMEGAPEEEKRAGDCEQLSAANRQKPANHLNHQQHEQQYHLNSSSKQSLKEAVAGSSRGAAAAAATCCLAGRTCFLVALGAALLLAAGLVALCALRLREPPLDGCSGWSHQARLNLQPSHFRLFATKTSYRAALEQLVGDQSGAELRRPPKRQVSVAAPFDPSYKSTEQLHRELTEERGCVARQLHLFARHAARYPSDSERENISNQLSQVQALIDLSKFSAGQPATTLNDTSPTNSTSSSAHQLATAAAKVCFNPLAQYKQWRNFMEPNRDNLITLSGALETQALARRYLALYPNLFKSARLQASGGLQVGVTEEERTAQTAINFVAPLNASNLQSLNQCDQHTLSQLVTGDPIKIDQVYANDCFKRFAKDNQVARLQFHKDCDRNLKKANNNLTIDLEIHLKEEPWLDQIASEVAEKLKLEPATGQQDTKISEKLPFVAPLLTHAQVKAIYKTCKYETALNSHLQEAPESVWCNLFTGEQLELLEYVEDLEDFFLQAYGHQNQAKSACQLTNELAEVFKSFQRNPNNNPDQVRLFFTHSQVLQKLIAAAVDLETDEAYHPEVMKKYLSLGRAPPMARQWRTSLMTPFSGNMAFTLYQCHQPVVATPLPNVQEVDVSSHLKVVTSLNERPIILQGCESSVCDLSEFFRSRLTQIDSKCVLEQICTKTVVLK